VNVYGQVARENRLVFEFQNGQVTRDNEINFKDAWTFVEVLLEFKWVSRL
jgi:hypothetical protein